MKKRLNRLRLRIKHSLMVFTSRYYTIVTDDGHGDFGIVHNCCINCSIEKLDYALSILEEIEDEGDQADAVDLANQIIANKN